MTTQQYLEQRYRTGLQRKLISLPTDLSAEERKQLLSQSLRQMIAHDRFQARKAAMHGLSTLQLRRIKTVSSIFQEYDAKKVTRIMRWLGGLQEHYSALVERMTSTQ